jgi:hypothetical protein
MSNYYTSHTFHGLFDLLDREFLHEAQRVKTERWQGEDISKRPEMATYELLNVTCAVPLSRIDSHKAWAKIIRPNLPWADVHFDERVCGEPLNPPPSYKVWPWGTNAEKFVNEHGQFNHSYPERLWPKYAGMSDQGELAGTIYDAGHYPEEVVMSKEGFIERYHYPDEPERKLCCYPHIGIRWHYGDLMDLVMLLAHEPLTRQAWIPLFFPEDTGVGDGGRKPCTLGYQFIMRDGLLHIYYPLRSCDYVRHFRDDIYLAIRLLLWVLEKCRAINPAVWLDVKPGTYTMHATSLHIFVNDYHQLKEKHNEPQR